MTIGTLMQSATDTEREAPEARVEPEADEPSLAWPESDPRWLLIPDFANTTEVERPDPAEAIEAFNRMLGERQRESATEVDARR